VNKMRLAETHLPGIFSRLCWMVDNRGMMKGLSEVLFSRSLFSRTKLAYITCRGICGGRVSIDGGPVNQSDGVVSILRPKTKVEAEELPKGVASFASRDYIGSFMDSLKKEILSRDEVNSLVRTFTRSSYLKSITKGYEIGSVTRRVRNVSSMTINCKTHALKGLFKGVLTSHPTLPTLRGQLTNAKMALMVRLISDTDKPPGMFDVEYLFGRQPNCVVASLSNDFDDMARFCSASVIKLDTITPRITLKRLCFT
jgi:hypothetical protein